MIIGISAPAVIVAIKIRNKESHTARLAKEIKRIFPTAFSIEILCVASAEIGGLLGLYYFGFNAFGITMAYMMAYALAGFTTFASILGRSSGHECGEIICACGHDTNEGFLQNIKFTFASFATGLKRMLSLHRQPDAWRTIKASLVVLVSAESGCIIAAATVDVIMYQYSTFLSIPSALVAGTFTVALMSARRTMKHEERQKAAK
jgi:hypothetical protein